MGKIKYIYKFNNLFCQYETNRKCIYLSPNCFRNFYLRLKDIKAFKQMIYTAYKQANKSILQKKTPPKINRKVYFYSRTSTKSKVEIQPILIKGNKTSLYPCYIYLTPKNPPRGMSEYFLSDIEILRVLNFLAKVENFVKTNNNNI